MALFRRNITGYDLLTLWRHVEEHEPVPRNEIVQKFYPGDADDPDQSDFRKTLNDAIDFLEEADQIIPVDDGYTITDEYRNKPSPRVALLEGLRAQDGENQAYIGVLEVLTREDRRYFDRKGELEDLLSDRRSGDTWNEQRLDYWSRVMAQFGITTRIQGDSDESVTDILALSQSLLAEMLKVHVQPNEPRQLADVLEALRDTHLPVYAGANRDSVASYMQRALKQAQASGLINLQQESDFGPHVQIDSSGYNSITLRTQ